MLLIIFAVLCVLWLLGLLGSVGGSLVHILLICALIAIIWHFASGRSRGDL